MDLPIMKRIFVVILLIVMFILQACTKDSVEEEVEDVSIDYTLVENLEGTTWKSFDSFIPDWITDTTPVFEYRIMEFYSKSGVRLATKFEDGLQHDGFAEYSVVLNIITLSHGLDSRPYSGTIEGDEIIFYFGSTDHTYVYTVED